MKSSSILHTVHTLLSAAITPGDVVIDATAGNGHDTVFLARCVGASGTVYAFDIQSEAINATKRATAEVDATVHVIHAGHEDLRRYIDPVHAGHIRAAVFNLGYLPGGDKAVVTTPETTVAAIEQVLDLLCSDGLFAVVCYQHDAGRQEFERVRDVLMRIPQHTASVLQCSFCNQVGNPPMAFVVTKQPYQKERS